MKYLDVLVSVVSLALPRLIRVLQYCLQTKNRTAPLLRIKTPKSKRSLTPKISKVPARIVVGLIALAIVFFFQNLSIADNGLVNFSTVDETDAMFDSSRVMDISVQIDPSDWQRMRYEHHNLLFKETEKEKQEQSSPYSYYKATVTIDGKTVKNVGVRKKGFLGSANAQRPSIKIHFDKYKKDERFSGLEMMTLNNNDSNGNQLSQYLSYFLFNKAGIPAPRCSFARVTVNGEYLGVYSHVESVRKRFLERNFNSSKGDLFEGQISDFREGFVDTFQKKTNKKLKKRVGLNKVVRALELADDQLIDGLDQVIALDDFYRYWAMETLIGFWDSYSGNTNNFFIYFDPSDDRIRFIPWGTDDALRPFFGGSNKANSVQANAVLPLRLYKIPESQKKYRTELRKLLQTVWNENELLEEIKNLKKLIGPDLHLPHDVFENALVELREFIKGRREILMRELVGEAPPNSGKLKVGITTGTGVPPNFAFEFDTKRIESAELKQKIISKTLALENLSKNKKTDIKSQQFYDKHKIIDSRAVVSTNPEPFRYGFPLLTIFWKHEGIPTEFRISLLIDPGFYQTENESPVDGYAVIASVWEKHNLDSDWIWTSFVKGRMKLDHTGEKDGQRVSGKLSLEFLMGPRGNNPHEDSP